MSDATNARARPAAVVLDALDAPPDPGLEARLGAAGTRELRALLAARARRWAATVAPDRAFEATTLDAARAALHDHAGPVLLAARDVPGLDARAAAAALDDLAAGCDVVVGVTYDARPYVIGVPHIDAPELALVQGSFLNGVLSAFAERGLTLGLVRHERRLASAADVHALAIDPLAPPDLAAIVRDRLRHLPRR